jgi:transposase-like protein
MGSKKLPTSLLEAIRYFSDEDVCVEYVAKLRWPDGPVCPRCESTEYSYLTTRRLWKCKACKKQYSVKVGTVFEDSPIPLDKWLCSIWLIANSKNGVSSYELHRAIGITQKSAWFVLQRLRLAMQTGTFEKMDGPVEVDETYVGGKAKYMHAWDRKRRGGVANKVMVIGTLERGGRVQAQVLPTASVDAFTKHIEDTTETGAKVYTDGHPSYRYLHSFDHETVDHRSAQYVDGDAHTNGIENFWSLVKRSLHGTYISVGPEHVQRYLDERMFTFNERDRSDLSRFALAVSMITGKRLTYAELING